MKNLQNNNQNQLELLKQLLLEDELRQLKQLASKLSSLEIDFNNSEVIQEKIRPVFDDVLLSNLSQKDSKTIDILASYLASVIATSTNQDIDKLSHALQAVISPAISSEIENNKDKMIDALYPIMGGMISKYVTQSIKEMMESINQKIEDGLSFDRYKRKLKSKFTGVSEVELLLEESSDANIESIIVIHKETGLMIAEAHQENKELDDAVMVASMASAIKDFVNDWIQNQDEEMASEVQILSYGNATLYIESAGSVYMIAFMDAEPDYEQRKEINQFFAKVLKRYSKLFQKFEGDMSHQDIPDVEKELFAFINQQTNTTTYPNTQQEHKNNIAKYILYLFIFGLIGYIGVNLYKAYSLYGIEKAIKQEINTTVTLEEKDSYIKVDGYITDISKYDKIESIIHKYSTKSIINNLHIPIKDIYSKINDINQTIPQQLSSTQHEIEKLQKLYNDLQAQNQKISGQLLDATKQINIQKSTLADMIKKNEKIKYIVNIKQNILSDLSSMFASNHYYNQDGSLDFHIKNLFLPNSVMYDKDKIVQIQSDYKKYIMILFSDKIRVSIIKSIVIEGYTDSSGSYTKNIELSAKRAQNIKEYLLGLPISKKYHIDKVMISKGMGSKNPIMKDGLEDKNASRRIKIRFELDNSKIAKQLKRVDI